MENKFELIRQWAKDRGIYEKGDPKTQSLKLMEEVGELSKAILNNDIDEIIDSIGDCIVVLTNLSELINIEYKGHCNNKCLEQKDKCDCFDITIENCINSAYDVIKLRTGKMENGTFKKDEIL